MRYTGEFACLCPLSEESEVVDTRRIGSLRSREKERNRGEVGELGSSEYVMVRTGSKKIGTYILDRIFPYIASLGHIKLLRRFLVRDVIEIHRCFIGILQGGEWGGDMSISRQTKRTLLGVWSVGPVLRSIERSFTGPVNGTRIMLGPIEGEWTSSMEECLNIHLIIGI